MVTPWFIVELRQSCLATKGAYLRPCSQKVVTAARELHSYLYLLEKVLGWKTNASADDTVCQLRVETVSKRGRAAPWSNLISCEPE